MMEKERGIFDPIMGELWDRTTSKYFPLSDGRVLVSSLTSDDKIEFSYTNVSKSDEGS